MQRYELVEGTSSKFWEVSVAGSTLTVTFGRIGTQGQTKDKDFDSPAAATKEKEKLIKEKTGKGYVLSGEGETSQAPKPKAPKEDKAKEAAPEPVAAAAITPAAAISAEPASAPPSRSTGPSAELEKLLGQPLPTRLHPRGRLDAAAAWSDLAGYLRRNFPKLDDEEKQALDWLRQRLGDEGPKSQGGAVGWLKSKLGGKEASLGTEEAQDWIKHLLIALDRVTFEGLVEDGPRRNADALCMAAFLQWLVATAGAPFAVEAALPLLGAESRRRGSYTNSAWSSPIDLGLRAALVNAPEDEYEAVLEMLKKACDAQTTWQQRVSYAFILGDDRATEHDLKPLAVLNAAEADGQDIGGLINFVPLVAEVAPSVASRWRAKRSYFLYFSYFDVPQQDLLATVFATAQRHGESPLPVLDWFLYYGHDEQRTLIASTMLATGEDGALTALLPILHEKWIRAALDAIGAADPALSFRQYLTALAGGRTDPVIRARVMDLVKQYPAETLRNWAAGDTRMLNYLEKLLEGQQVTLASDDGLPLVLRDPPWRKKAKKSEDTILALSPIATPFLYEPTGPMPEENRWRLSRARTISDKADLVKAIMECETYKLPSWYSVPPPSQPLPKVSDSEEAILAFLTHRILEVYRAKSYALSSAGWDRLFCGIELQPDGVALALWNCPGVIDGYVMRDSYPRMMKRFGARALPGLLRQIEADPIGMLEFVKDVDASEIAPHAARALLKLKKARAPAMQWLRKHRDTAVMRLIPDAVGKKGAARDAAEHALRWLAAAKEDGRAAIEAIAAQYAKQDPLATSAVAEVLDRNPLDRYPARIAKLPDWFKPASFARPMLKQGGALSDEAMTALAEMISFSVPDGVYAGIDIVKQEVTSESLANFAWDLFSGWLAEGAPSKDGWALRALGWIGNDESARRLTRLIRKWPGEAAHARAVTGLDVLADIGTDVALMNLNGIAEKLKFKGLQEKAREKIAALAEARDLTPEELADRLAPDLDLDERGGLDLIFGERRFRAGFDEYLKPWVKDETGRRLKDLPKPNKSDDETLSGEAVKQWAALKKDARAVASLQITRLENMLSTSRRAAPEVFWLFFASHPLIRHLTQRLVWGVYEDSDPRTAPTTIFRVADDLSITDANDNPLDLDFSADANGLIGLVHPLHLPAGGLDAWGALFGDYEIAQPFPQLGREIHELTDAEKRTAEIVRFEGIKVESPRLRGMSGRGWNLGAPQDGGGISWLERQVRFLDGTTRDAMLYFSDGIFTGGGDWEDKLQTLGKLSLEQPYGMTKTEHRFGELDPVTASEMLRGLALLAETAVS